MKKYLPILSIAVFAVACNSKPAETETRTIQSTQTSTAAADTTGLAQFQQWKAQNELAAANEAQQAQQAQQPAAAPTKTVTIIREVRVPQQTTTRKTTTKKSSSPAPATPSSTEQRPAGTASSGTSGQGSGTSESAGTASAPSTQPAETAKDKGWSKSTKGAVIGGAGGAVLGAIINKKNRAAGAVIGGVLGAGVGYGIGKKKESKDTTQH